MRSSHLASWAIGALAWPVLMFACSTYFWPGPGLPPQPPERIPPSRISPPTPTPGSRVYISSPRSSVQFWSDPQSGQVHMTVILPAENQGPPPTASPAQP